MATIETYLLADGRTKRYRVRYRTPDRRSTDKSGFTTKRDAQAFAATVEVSKLRGEYVAPAASRITIGQLGPAWLARQTHLKPSAFRPLEIAWRVHVEPRWGSVRLSDVKFTDAEVWVAELSSRRGATTVKRAYGVLASIIDGAVRDRCLLANPIRGITNLPRKVKGKRVYLTHEQVDALAREAKEHGVLVQVLAYTGLRWGEATALRVCDLDLLRRRLRIVENAVLVGTVIHVGTPKSAEPRTVPIPRFLLESIARRCEGKGPDDLLFPGRDGGRLKLPYSKNGWFAGAVKRSGVPRLTPHGLRHTAASLAVQSGAHVKTIQRMLGHESAAMTLDTYADLFDGDLDNVAEHLDSAWRESARVARRSVGDLWDRGRSGSVS